MKMIRPIKITREFYYTEVVSKLFVSSYFITPLFSVDRMKLINFVCLFQFLSSSGMKVGLLKYTLLDFTTDN